MSKHMTRARATEFGEAWNTRDPALIASFFADDGVYHASVGPEHLGKSFQGRDQVREGVAEFFRRFPDGRFDNLKVNLFGSFGTFEWDFVATNAEGQEVVTAGCDLLEFEGDMIKVKNAFRKAHA